MRKELANAIRVLSMDAVELANSGHPGAPMGMAEMAEALWGHSLKHNPADPYWINRDRFVLSNGHASMLLYSLLHLTGYDLSMDDIRDFRKLHSKTPGHPEYGITPGVETTTGPLGQGIATAVGMALAEQILAENFNKPNLEIIDHYTYVFLGDGCMMEGISHEACSFAGTLGLGKLIAMYDSNDISIDGNIEKWFTEDVAARFKAYGWHVVESINGHDATALDNALAQAKQVKDKPSLIICKTSIGCGSPNSANNCKCHGAPLGSVEIVATRANINWVHPPFEIPENIMQAWNAKERGAKAQNEWNAIMAEYQKLYPNDAAELNRRVNSQLPDDFADNMAKIIKKYSSNQNDFPTRVASQKVLEELAAFLPELVGGSADLAGSVGVKTSFTKVIERHHLGNNYINYGVREFAMGAIMNGLSVHGGFIPYAGTFLIFSDYARNAIRLTALMGLRVIWILTHDSIGVGEDGATHQPIEQIPSLRLIPNINIWRPCDILECAFAWKSALENKNVPTCFCLSRQKLPAMDYTPEQLDFIGLGAYVLHDCAGSPEGIIIATGSEIGIALEATKILQGQGKKIRLVSMPCAEIFEQQDNNYKESVLPKGVRARVAVEAAQGDFWYKYTGLDGKIVAMSEFGASAPGNILFEHFEITTNKIVQSMQSLLD